MLTEAEYEAEKALEREKRLQLLRAMRGVLARKLRALDNDKPAPLSDVVAGVRMVSDQLRMEFKAAAAAEPVADLPAPADDPLAGLKVHRPTG